MGFFDAVKTCFLKYVTFSGRASRSEYWWFFLFCLICESLAPIVATLVLFLPSLAAAWRRLHDTGRSGLFVLLPTLVGGAFLVIPNYVVALVLIVSTLLLLFWLTRPSQPGTNDYGPNPHEVSP